MTSTTQVWSNAALSLSVSSFLECEEFARLCAASRTLRANLSRVYDRRKVCYIVYNSDFGDFGILEENDSKADNSAGFADHDHKLAYDWSGLDAPPSLLGHYPPNPLEPGHETRLQQSAKLVRRTAHLTFGPPAKPSFSVPVRKTEWAPDGPPVFIGDSEPEESDGEEGDGAIESETKSEDSTRPEGPASREARLQRRTDPDLIRRVKTLGQVIAGDGCTLELFSFPARYRPGLVLDDYDGQEPPPGQVPRRPPAIGSNG